METTKMLLQVRGDYCAQHEMSFSLYTLEEYNDNYDKEFETLEEAEASEDGSDYGDLWVVDVLTIDEKQYISERSL